MIHRYIAAVTIGDVVERRRTGPAVSAVVLCAADQPSGDSYILSNVFELGNHQAIVAMDPGVSAVRAVKQPAIGAGVDGIGITRLKGHGMLIRMKGTARVI